ncbi:MAG: Heavy metal efflux outer membrane protein CzcC family [Labilithrix sp.]|nr:Heavy metal efflux outer membrane protein CzcC family [Labilithrix sp.]
MWSGAAALLVATLAQTGAADEAIALTRNEAAQRGAQHGPVAREAAAAVPAATRLREDGRSFLPYAPRLTAFAGRRTGDFGEGLEVGGSLVQDLSLHKLTSRRDEVAQAVAHASRDAAARARLEGAALAALAWVDLLEAQALVRLRDVARGDADEIGRVAEARVRRGVGLPLESVLASAEVGSAELGQRDAEGRLFEARTALSFAVGMPEGSPVASSGELIPPPLGPEAVAAREHPAVTAARSSLALAKADAELVRAQASPTFGIGVNVAREGTGEQLVTGTVSVPVPLLDPARFETARQRTLVASAEGQAARVRAEVGRDSAIAAHERLHTREVHETLRDRVLVPLREGVRLARAAYQAGTQDVTSLLVLRQRLVAAEEQLGHAAADVLRADVKLEAMQGTLLDGPRR